MVSEVGNKINHCLPDPAPLVTGCPAEDPVWEGLTLTQGFTTSLSNLCGFTSAQPSDPVAGQTQTEAFRVSIWYLSVRTTRTN